MQRIQLIWVVILFIIPGCKEGPMSKVSAYESRLDRIPRETWDILASKAIFFGHQSVGQNILEGLHDVMETHPAIKLAIQETTEATAFRNPVFAHAFIGENKAADLKIEHFKRIMDNGIGPLVDIAFIKFCFVDIDRDTDIKGLFDRYKGSVQTLRDTFPNLKILHMTVPLTTQPPGLKAAVKRVLGRYRWIQQDNIKRNQFNEMLRQSFGGFVYDLAERESTSLDGKRATFSYSGKTYSLLHPSFTDDGGHLNRVGRRVVAVDLLVFLAGIAAS
jgi:hypothetical protein